MAAEKKKKKLCVSRRIKKIKRKDREKEKKSKRKIQGVRDL